MAPFGFTGLRSLFLTLFIVVAIASVGTSRTVQPLVPQDYCAGTEKAVPVWCAKEFVVALFNGPPPTFGCCVRLACVQEKACFYTIRRLCPILQLGDPSHPLQCPPPA